MRSLHIIRFQAWTLHRVGVVSTLSIPHVGHGKRFRFEASQSFSGGHACSARLLSLIPGSGRIRGGQRGSALFVAGSGGVPTCSTRSRVSRRVPLAPRHLECLIANEIVTRMLIDEVEQRPHVVVRMVGHFLSPIRIAFTTNRAPRHEVCV